MPDPKRYVNIGIDRSYFPELRSAKLEWQAEIGDTLSWSEFFRILLDKDLRHPVIDPADVKVLKFWYSGCAGREVSWSEFLKWLGDSVFGERDMVWNIEHADADAPEYVEMRQAEVGRPVTPEELESVGVLQDVTAEDMVNWRHPVGPGGLGSVFLSERSCQRIADMLFDKAKSEQN